MSQLKIFEGFLYALPLLLQPSGGLKADEKLNKDL
jgi:hypothetical protein